MPSLKSLHQINRYAWQVLLACLVSTALAMSVIRFWLLPRAADWRGELETKIGAMIDETVRIKSLSAGMRGFKPELMIRGFSIDNAAKDGPNLQFERLGVGLDMTASLLSRKPVVDRIELEGGRLRISRLPDGGIKLLGLKPSGPPLWLFVEGEVRFRDLDLEWISGEQAPAMPLGRAQARLRNDGAEHAVDARLDLPGKLGKSLKFSAKVEGNPLATQAWNGAAYVEVKRLREGAFGEFLPLRMRSGEASLQAWGIWKNGRVSEVKGKLDLDHPVFSWRAPDGKDGLLGLDRVGGWLQWREEERGWRLDASRLTLAHKGRSWPESDFSIAATLAGDGSLDTLRAAFNYLHLDDVQNLLAGLPLESLQESLRTYGPHGEIRNARLIYQADGKFGFCGELANFSVNAIHDAPGFNKLTGKVCGNDRDGRIDLTTGRMELALPGAYLKPLVFDGIGGSFQWRRFGGIPLIPPRKDPAEQSPGQEGSPTLEALRQSSWRMVGNGVELSSPGFHAKGGFALDLPAGGDSPSLDMQAQFSEVEAARLKDYLPLSAMSSEAAAWLGGAFVGGKVKNADVLFNGRLSDFPFDHGEGLFETRVDTENLELAFSPDWPHLNGMNARVLLFGSKLFVDYEGGKIGDIPLQATHAQIDDYIGDGAVEAVGHVATEFQSAVKFLQKTPIRYLPERLSKVADPYGAIDLDLKLVIPLDNTQGNAEVDGLLRLENDTMALKSVNLKLEGLTGELSFDENGVAGRQIAGKALDADFLVDVDQHGEDIVLEATGQASVAALRRALPGDLWKYADGSFAYRLGMQISESLDSAGRPYTMKLATDLAGVDLKLPEPLAKSPAEKRNLSAEWVLQRGDHFSLKLDLGNEGGVRLRYSLAEAPRLETGDISWGKPLPSPTDAPGLSVYLHTSRFDAGTWSGLIGELGSQSVAAQPRALDIQVEKLSWNGQDLGAFVLSGVRFDDDLQGQVHSHYARGSYALAFNETGPALLRLDLETLLLPKLPEDKNAQSSLAAADPANLPALQISARRLLRQGADLGALELEADRWGQGLQFKKVTLSSQNHDLSLNGNWSRQDGRDQTRLVGNLKVRDLGHFLTQLEYGKEILNTPTQATFDLSWEGAPHQYSYANLFGDIRLKLGRGSVLQMEPGLGRALGMLNLQTLRRLLLLDFSDIFGKGLAYDGMEGAFHLNEGQATTKGLMIDAAAADILVVGRVGLVDHDFDETVSVVPHTLASIPLAGAIVGGSAVGAVIDMANQLVGGEASNIASTNYQVTGSWDNPQIKRLQGSMAVEVINKAWSDFKNMSGMGGKGDNN